MAPGEAWHSVDIGDTHTAGLTTRGRVFSWGLGMMGQLGLTESAIKIV